MAASSECARPWRGREGGGEERGEPRRRAKTKWLHLSTHILSSGRATKSRWRPPSGAPSARKEPLFPCQKRLSLKSALRTKWHYIPEHDADKERAQVIWSIPHGSDRRSEMIEYK